MEEHARRVGGSAIKERYRWPRARGLAGTSCLAGVASSAVLCFKEPLSCLLMVVKPPPQPLTVGHDIVRISRVANVWRSHTPRAFVRRVFTRLEWPTLLMRCRRELCYSGSETGIMNNQTCSDSNTFWRTMNVNKTLFPPESDLRSKIPVEDGRSPSGRWSQFLAGRLVVLAQSSTSIR